MDNLTFVDEENIPMVHQDDDYDDYRQGRDIPVPDTAETTSTPRLKEKLKRHKFVSLCRYLDVTENPGLAGLDQFTIKKNSKTGDTELLFFDGNSQW